MDIYAVDLDRFIGEDHDVLTAADGTGLDQITPFVVHADDYVGGLDLNLFLVHDVPGADLRVSTEGVVELDIEGCDLLFGDVAGLQDALHVLPGDHQRIDFLVGLVGFHAVTEFGMYRLHQA